MTEAHERSCQQFVILPQNLGTWRQEVMVPCCCFCSVAKSCPTLCDLMDCSPPASPVPGVSQARILDLCVLQHWQADFLPLNHQGSQWYHVGQSQTLVSCFLRAWKIGVLVSLLRTSAWELLGLVYRLNVLCMWVCRTGEMSKKMAFSACLAFSPPTSWVGTKRNGSYRMACGSQTYFT